MKAQNLITACILSCASIAPAFAAGQAGADPAAAGADSALPAPAKLTAEQIAERNVAARGGLKAWRAVRSMSMSGKIDAGRARNEAADALADARRVSTRQLDPKRARAFARAEARKTIFGGGKAEAEPGKMIQLPFQMDLQRPRKMHLEIQFQGQTAVQVFDGEHGWKLRPYLGHGDVQPYTAEEMEQAAQQQDLDGPLIDYAAKGSKLEAEGVEQVEGQDAYKLKLTLKGGQVRHVWVDAHSFLEVKIDGSRRMDGKPRPTATYFRDYRSVDGLKIPFVLETRVEGVKDAHTIHVERVALNARLADTRFAKPQ